MELVSSGMLNESLRTKILRKLVFSSTFVHNKRNYMFEAGTRGGVMVKALLYKPASRGFDSRWCHWNF
jgi:hypothetical protein